MKNNRIRAGLAALMAAGLLAATPGIAFADDTTPQDAAGANDGIMVASSRYSVEDLKGVSAFYIDHSDGGTIQHPVEGFDYRKAGPYLFPWDPQNNIHIGLRVPQQSQGWTLRTSNYAETNGEVRVEKTLVAPDGTIIINYVFKFGLPGSINTGNLSQVQAWNADGSSVGFSPSVYEYQVNGNVTLSNLPSGWQARISNGGGVGSVFFIDPNGLASKDYYFYGGDVILGNKPTPAPKPDPKPDYSQIDSLASQHKADLKDGEFLFSPASGGTLDVSGGSKASDANVQIWQANWSDAQMWTVSHDAQGYVTLANKGSNLVLDAHGAKAANGTNIAQHGSNGGRNQKWIAVKNQDGSYTFLSAMNPRFALDVANGSNANGTNVRLWTSNGSNAQKWRTNAWPTADKDTEGRSPVYRLYNPRLGEHLWTMSLAEYKKLVRNDGWRGEDTAFHAWDKDSNTGDEVYRLYNPRSGRHHLTMSVGERDSLVKGHWRYEGIAFRYKTTDPTIWRAYNPGNGDHLWTLSKNEYDNTTRNGWRGEGIAFGQGRDKAREASFTDVDGSTPHAQAIDWMDGKGISTGWWEDDANRAYRPSTRVTRQDYAAFLHRLAGNKTSASTAKTFTDVTESTPHKADIDWATAEGIITGYGDNTFQGMSPIQRQDAVAMLWRLAGSPEPTKAASFTEVNESTPHAKAIAWAQESGVATGMPDGSFGVGKPIIRQDMAAMLQRADTIVNA